MRQPPGFEDPKRPNMVCKLDQALYGLKQASRVWNVRADQAMERFGLIRHTHDPCLYYLFKDDGEWMIVMLFVDDNFIAGSDQTLEKFIRHLSKEFETRILGAVKRFVGINVELQPNGAYHLDQHEDIEAMLKKFSMAECKPAATPGLVDVSSEQMKSGDPVDSTMYRSAIGSLYWIALATRPDILAPVNICSQYQSAPTKRAWDGVKKIFRYLRGTTDFPLVIDTGDDLSQCGFADSSHGDPILARHSMTGGVHFIGNAPVLWTANKQKTPAHSSCEAELCAGSSVSRDAMWLRHLMRPFYKSGPIPIYIDNQAVIHISESYGLIRKVKHLEIQDLYLRVLVQRKLILVKYIPSARNLADLMTKGVRCVSTFRRLRDWIMTAGLKGGVYICQS